MAWTEWEQAQASAAEKAAQTRLNTVDAGTGGGGGQRDLIVRSDELGALGSTAYQLRESLAKDGTHADDATTAAATALKSDGLATGSALQELQDAWETKVGTLKEACAHISNHLDYTKAAHAKEEEKISTSMRDAEGKLMTVSRISEFI
ncbi:hypothetical protein JJV70_10110 [Streptomyces sp. JJ66]|uniref:hypothetical protein n=1 Tax=Streptomyces sp. JJ66 TaxID=2803843 RepID=UPI001C55E003|nr:hypothetical protein [Streptomyces sp. JJ66]MBW1602457.1 hypothetical protein [Streptomyces sp. JJ66]